MALGILQIVMKILLDQPMTVIMGRASEALLHQKAGIKKAAEAWLLMRH